jgi:hypothetical protein
MVYCLLRHSLLPIPAWFTACSGVLLRLVLKGEGQKTAVLSWWFEKESLFLHP